MYGLLEDHGIPPIFFKNACSFLCHPLAFIFQLLFDEGCLPPLWRKAFITAIDVKYVFYVFYFLFKKRVFNVFLFSSTFFIIFNVF